MTKKILALVLFIFSVTSFIMGQENNNASQDKNKVNTTKYWLNTVPFYQLPNAKEGDYYSHNLEIIVPKDTIRTLNNKVVKLHIKDIRITGLTNLHKGISYSPTIVDNPDEDVIHLILYFYGRVINVNNSPITINTRVTFNIDNGKSLVQQFEIKNIIIKEDKSTKIDHNDDEIGLKSLKYYPDPFNNKTEVSFWSSKLQLVEFEVRDAIGNLKFKKTFTAKVGSNKVGFSQKDLPNGLYLYSVRTDEFVLAKRLIIK